MRIRPLEPADLDAALALTQAEGWSHRRADWQLHMQLGKGWAACADDGTIGGVALWWDYGGQLGTIGLVVVGRSRRGEGVGRILMKVILDDTGERPLRLVATSVAVPLYRQFGFIDCGGIVQLQGILEVPPDLETAPVVNLRPVAALDLRSLCELDAVAFGARRDNLIGTVLERGAGFLAELDGNVIGFALTRASGHGTLIGPVIAGNQEMARVLIAQNLGTLRGFVRVDVPSDATELVEWLKSVGMQSVDTYTAMSRGDPRVKPEGTASVFGLVSQAFG